VRRLAAWVLFALLVAGCGGSSQGFYDEDAKALAEQAAREKLDGPTIASIGSAKERSDCPRAPGPCLKVEVRTEDEMRPVGGGPSQGTLRSMLDAFVWLERMRGRWKVTRTTFGPPRDVSVNGVPYNRSD
jgi:hypothetical protein